MPIPEKTVQMLQGWVDPSKEVSQLGPKRSTPFERAEFLEGMYNVDLKWEPSRLTPKTLEKPTFLRNLVAVGSMIRKERIASVEFPQEPVRSSVDITITFGHNPNGNSSPRRINPVLADFALAGAVARATGRPVQGGGFIRRKR